MQYVLIGINKLGTKTVGYRVINTDDMKVTDISEFETSEIVKKETKSIVGLYKGYESITTGVLKENQHAIILYKLKDGKLDIKGYESKNMNVLYVVGKCGDIGYFIANVKGEVILIGNNEVESLLGIKSLGARIINIGKTDKGYKFIGSYKMRVYEPTEENINAINNRNEKFSSMTSKLDIFNCGYTITPDYGIIAKYDIEKLLVVKPARYIRTMGFAKMETLKELVITSKDLNRIEKNAFSECSNLKSIRFNEGLEDIQDGAFFSCYKLGDIEFPISLKYIRKDAFKYCSCINTITVSVNTNIHKKAFRYGINIIYK